MEANMATMKQKLAGNDKERTPFLKTRRLDSVPKHT